MFCPVVHPQDIYLHMSTLLYLQLTCSCFPRRSSRSVAHDFPVAPTCDILISPEVAVLQELLVAEAGRCLLVIVVGQAVPVPGGRRWVGQVVILQRWVAQAAGTGRTGHGRQVTGHGPRVTGHRSGATGYGSPVTGQEPQVTKWPTEVTGYRSRIMSHGSRLTGHRSQVRSHRYRTTGH